ncbi:hypothetical protein PR202_gb22169 [Eleusine coracana subsp. coracana]|uniref:DOMON domain-containing protein n=1 Tax=Eleusine coracana subsp. coracana TaxID=191504 RepID=A0AAV5FH09_ELECO|nr:hypothetical protein QOZ80_6AG0540430 [Eleusine coracana subsp. coracana]GJN33556.1 hypothetical protein PR202_gb22169 [Eleusine coracana subsp. coracana]
MASVSVHLLPAALFLLLATSPAATRGATTSNATTTAAGCGADEKFPAGRSYANCTALGRLGATLHWAYDPKSATMSVAFAARPAAPGGWVAWAVNPTGDGMAGAQALVAFKSAAAGGPYVVRTYNVTGYTALPAGSTPIAFKATDLAADESAAAGGGKVRLYGKLQLKKGTKMINHIWQVGSAVTNGAPAKHAFAKENLDAKGKLALVAGVSVAPAPTPAATGSSSSPAKAGGGNGNPAPSGGKKSAAAHVSAPVLAVLALLGCLATLVV